MSATPKSKGRMSTFSLPSSVMLVMSLVSSLLRGETESKYGFSVLERLEAGFVDGRLFSELDTAAFDFLNPQRVHDKVVR
jgi:hypothetical protein